jgi:CRISPR-associated protein Cmr6
VLEVGLRLHHTYGTPVIPGSALKGLAATFCHTSWGQAHLSSVDEPVGDFRRGGRYHALLFGTTEASGEIEFHDAWLTPESLGTAFHLDVMTPHHREWQLDKAAPSDLDSPVPVSFLSVSGMFDVRLSWAGPSGVPNAQIDAWTALAMDLVIAALDERGIGGKTRSGYGRLTRTGVAAATPAPRRIDPPKAGERVEARLLVDKTRNGGWKAVHVASQLAGSIVNTADVPASQVAGDAVELIVHHANPRAIGFSYPTGPASPGQPRRAHAKARPR